VQHFFFLFIRQLHASPSSKIAVGGVLAMCAARCCPAAPQPLVALACVTSAAVSQHSATHVLLSLCRSRSNALACVSRSPRTGQRRKRFYCLLFSYFTASTMLKLDDGEERVGPNHSRCIVIIREIPGDTPVEVLRTLNFFLRSSCRCFAEGVVLFSLVSN